MQKTLEAKLEANNIKQKATYFKNKLPYFVYLVDIC